MEISHLLDALDRTRRRIRQLECSERAICRELEAASCQAGRYPRIEVSAHAQLRYLERVGCVNMAEVRDRILPDAVAEQARVLGSGLYPIQGSHFAQIRNGAVVTVKSFARYEAACTAQLARQKRLRRASTAADQETMGAPMGAPEVVTA